MKFNTLTPILWTSDLTATIEFYTAKLGFILEEYNSDWGWCNLKKDDIFLMFSNPPQHALFEKAIATGTFYFNVDKVDEIWQEIHEQVEVYYPLENFDYGMKEFAIKDNNGYILQFGSPIE